MMSITAAFFQAFIDIGSIFCSVMSSVGLASVEAIRIYSLQDRYPWTVKFAVCIEDYEVVYSMYL